MSVGVMKDYIHFGRSGLLGLLVVYYEYLFYYKSIIKRKLKIRCIGVSV